MNVVNEIDLSDLALIVGKSSKDNKELIQALVKIVEAIPKSPKMDLDLSPLIAAVKAIKMPEYKEPKININNADLIAAMNEKSVAKDAISYEFNVKRGGDGKIVSVIANPI